MRDGGLVEAYSGEGAALKQLEHERIAKANHETAMKKYQDDLASEEERKRQLAEDAERFNSLQRKWEEDCRKEREEYYAKYGRYLGLKPDGTPIDYSRTSPSTYDAAAAVRRMMWEMRNGYRSGHAD